MSAGPLAGLGIVVTRPAHQAEALAQGIAAAGGTPILFPALEVVDLPDLQTLQGIIERLDEFHLAIFISPNAVNKAMNLIRARREWPPALTVATIGKGSRRALAAFGVTEVLVPAQRFDSEGLLETAPLQSVQGKRIVIFRGDGGRELLGDELTRRGASVTYAECYRRQKPDTDSGDLRYRWARGEVHAVTIASSETLHNFYDLIGKLGQQWLVNTPLFVPHERIAAAARAMGLGQVIVTPAGDEGLLQGLIEWGATQKTG